MAALNITTDLTTSNDWQNDVETEWKRFHEWLNQSETRLLACG